MLEQSTKNVKGLVRTDFNGAHWRLTVAGEVAGLWPQEQEATRHATAISVALAKRDAAIEAGYLEERSKFIDVIANMQREEREMAALMGRLQAAAEAAESVLDSFVGLGPQVALRPRAIAALGALRGALKGEAK